MIVRLFALLTAVAAAVATAPAAAQPARTVPVDDPAYVYVERLQRRGHLLELHPTALPYTEGQIAAALARLDGAALDAREAAWAEALRQRGAVAVPRPGELALRGDVGVRPRVSTSARLDPLRPLGADVSIPVGDGAFYTRADGHAAMGSDRVVLQIGFAHDLYYNDAPDGLDIVKRAMMRNEEAYGAYRGPLVDVALGRVGTHWGRPGRDALLLSDNAPPFEAVHLRVGGDRFSYRGALGQLDSYRADGTSSGVVGERPGDRPNTEARIDRFGAFHRIDWRPVPNLAVTLQESALYSGANAGLSLAYLTPLHSFSFLVDNTPKNVENNGAFGGMLWAYARGWTLHGEVVLDDVDVVNGIEPSSAALTGSLTRADLVPGVDAEVGLTAVTARAFNAPQPEGDYLYADYGLGVEFNDFVRLSGRAEWFAAPGLTLSPHVVALWQGAETPEGPYPDNDLGTILTGDVERTVRVALGARLQPVPWAWATADVGVNASTDPVADGLHGMAAVGVRLSLAGRPRAGF